MSGSRERVKRAFAHEPPDRTPLFEIFCPGHPIYWDICGRKTGDKSWSLEGVDYVYNKRTHLVEPARPVSYTSRVSEEAVRRQIEEWDGTVAEPSGEDLAAYYRLRELAAAEGQDWLYLAEVGAGTGVAFYPPFMLMWILTEPELFRRWLEMQKANSFPWTTWLIEQGMELVAMGGDVSCDKGPFLSPRHYHEFLLPVIQEHVALIHEHGAQAIYTSDGNHWAIKHDFFFNSGVDGYKEVDKAAGMTWERLIAEGVDRRLCILGNVDARYTLCLGRPEEVQEEVFQCLRYGQHSPGGHLLHASHSVHEDVKVENYHAMVGAYRGFFGLEPLPR